MKKSMLLLLALCLLLSACAGNPPKETTEAPALAPAETTQPLEIRDYAGQVELDLSSETVKQKVTVKTFIDGDTTHFHVPESVNPSGILKARYLAVNTPESTGKIEEYGKKASNFTREKLSNAVSILIESETDHWDPDSTGDRYLVWVWYIPQGQTEYRNLNVEILQNGLAIANNTAGGRYGETALAALNQAKAQKLNIYSGQKDPDYFYGEAVELTLKELRTNIESYNGMKVAFNAVITINNDNGVYVESLDPETGLYYGMSVYYGFNLNGPGLDILSVGNEVRIVGSVQYYEAAGTYQVSDLNYRMMQPDDPGNIQMLSQGHQPAFQSVTADTFVNGTVQVLAGEEEKTFPFAQLALGTTVEMGDLKVVDAYTTTGESSSSKGAITLFCEADGIPVTLRTTPLLDENNQLITQDAYLGKTICVKGIVDLFDGQYQIKIFTPDHITVTEE